MKIVCIYQFLNVIVNTIFLLREMEGFGPLKSQHRMIRAKSNRRINLTDKKGENL